MVKVQKPQPKSLNKGNKIDGVVKEQQGKLKKSQSMEKSTTKTALAVASVADIAAIKKNVSKKAENVAKTKPTASKIMEQNSKPKKKPLVLAPPISPVAVPAPKAAIKKLEVISKKLKTQPKVEISDLNNEKVVVEGKKSKKQLLLEKTAKNEKPKKAAPKNAKLKIPTQVKQSTPPIKSTKETSKPPKSSTKVEPKSNKTIKAAQMQPKIAPTKSGKATKAPTLGKSKQPPPKAGEEVKQLVKVTKTESAKKGSNVEAKKKITKPAALKKKGKGGKKQQTLKKKVKKEVELNFELKPFDEDKFNEIVTKKNVQKVCEALKHHVADEIQKRQKATSIFSDYRYILQVCSYKIPSCPKRLVKLPLKHSLVGTDDDVAVIVTDLQRGARFDSEPTVQHYEDLFREAGIKQRLTVVPFNQLRNDMGTYEAKRKFVNSYDYLLCDGRIVGQATAFLGNCTQKSRNVLHAVRISKDNQLPKEFARALCRTAYRQLRKGDLTSIPVGNHEHSGQQLAENILAIVQELQQHYPGGLPNIRSIYLKIDLVGTSALPLYISMCAPPADTPYVVGPREQRMLKLKKQANEVLTKFALTKDVEFVKLTSEQVKRKAELREKRLALKAEDAKNAAKDKDDDDTPVPKKKARKNEIENAKVGDNVDSDNDDDEDEDDEEIDDGDEEVDDEDDDVEEDDDEDDDEVDDDDDDDE